ncbi:very short patch repair endonuclease [Sulfuricurvum sp. IAE1]|uniref:very short patch repair endonuclease n=1 Tax=Sulfuricurvum sp. IAE1 TaxID=2546102 RepID=UPI00104C60B8|nr:very short patch repair endonuclease [Sulfuricurvum sp. IAE1]
MADVFPQTKRSEVMSQIRSGRNKCTELALIRVFLELGIKGWRRNQPLFGRPDFVFRQQRLVVFVDGCFWHCCPQHQTWPKNNARFWRDKLQSNRARDREVNRVLRSKGWRVLRIWEHELKAKNRRALIARLRRYFTRE